MKIAVLSDIHGNLTALNAVLKDIKKLGINKFIIAGDHIIDCPNPNEVLEKIKTLDAYIIKGNREEYLLDYYKGKHDEWNKYKQMGAILYTYNIISEDNMKYIDGLPEQLRISLPQMDDIRVVHGSPYRINEELFPDKHLERLEKTLKNLKEQVLICGHTHYAWSKEINNKLIVNPGSVGVPFNENKSAEYAVLTWSGAKWKVSHHQVKYDLKELQQLFLENKLFEKCQAWSRLTLQSIKEGRNVTIEFIRYAYKLAQNGGVSEPKFVPNSIWDMAEKLWFNS
ncbi:MULTISPECIES: metallophosphoesterase family protein [Clostridium]|uniref:metallophosphoesterase family protein n=1 Tax=Clostridium TaxID=1485 RepID=UPI0008245CB9|nr:MULTISPECIES: YfcE family phosphodiesterase [Clostridium]PJI09014.1 metallophosphoesterase [Clostridium sp. CT7]